jgi:hypothetical protein
MSHEQGSRQEAGEGRKCQPLTCVVCHIRLVLIVFLRMDHPLSVDDSRLWDGENHESLMR